MNETPEHLKNPHLSAWSIGLTIAGCSLALFSPLVINKNPQLGIVGTASGAVLSIAGWVMGSQSEKSIKLQAKLEEKTEEIFLRRLGMEYELEKIKDGVYLNESQQMILQQKNYNQITTKSQNDNQIQSQKIIQNNVEDIEYNNDGSNIVLLDRQYNNNDDDDVAITTQVVSDVFYENIEDDTVKDLQLNNVKSIDKIIKDLAICRTSILLCSQPGTGKTTFTLAWLWETVANNPTVKFYIIGQKRDNWLGLSNIDGILTVVSTDIDELVEKVSKVCEILKTRCQTPEEDRDFENKPVRLIFDDYTATYSAISSVGGKTLKEFIANISFLVTVGREFNVTLYISAHSFNLKQLGLEGADIRNCLVLMGLGFKSYTEKGESGGFDSVDSILNNQYIVKPGNDTRDTLMREYKKLKIISIEKSKQLLFCTLGGASLKLLSDLRWVRNESLLPKVETEKNDSVIKSKVPKKIEIDLKKNDIPDRLQSENPLDCSTWLSVDYPNGLQRMPQHQAGVYAVFIEGYQNPLYIGESKDLWRRWNNTGSWEHHVKKHLKDIGDLKVNIAFYITKGWDDQKRLSLESELQIKYQTPWNGTSDKTLPDKTLSPSAQAVFDYIKDKFTVTGKPISTRDCYRNSPLRTKFGVNAENTELIFDELQSFGLGKKIVEEINGFISVKFMPNL
jgi:hypothetical protein